MVSKNEEIVGAGQYKNISDNTRNKADEAFAFILNTMGHNPDSAAVLHQPMESKLAKIIGNTANSQLPFNDSANRIAIAAYELKELDSSNAGIIERITHLQAEIARMSSHSGKSSGAALTPPNPNMTRSDLQALLGNVMVAHKEISQSEGHHHDDSSLLGTAVMAVAGAGAFIFNGATTTITAIGGNLAALLGLGTKAAIDVTASDIKLANNMLPLAANIAETKKNPNITV